MHGHSSGIPDPELHLRRPGGRPVPDRDRAGARGRGGRVRRCARDGPLLPAARHRPAGRADARVLHGAGGAGHGHRARPAVDPRHRQHLPPTDPAGQGGDHAGRGQRWPRGAGDRRRLVRAGAPAARVRVRHVHRAVRPARRGAADHRADAARPAPQRGRRVVPRRERGQRAPHPRRPADHARRRRGEEDVRARRALRRPPQHHLRPRGPSPEAGGARPALRRGRPGPLRASRPARSSR